ncbi:presqualene diphosphate synthase HpnD [Neisseria canis]|uniref:Poly-isoprenyl transferase n=1 Tax=Neisseria canis TaxID=493 RepID=A0A1X3D017_9NEIS|nr:presqualene diphosphate synthase HpnD [Neisseria canis]OSI13218.1 squalene synthase HpnD [Neisseria canis]VEF01900.1 poly-isoprenyl transferase [Neisseria canis]
MQPIEYCQQKAAESGSSFLAGFRFLPQNQRDAMTALYAFCREVDDAVDDCSDPGVAQTTLNWWRGDLAAVFSDRLPEHPVNQALQGIAREFGLPHEEFEEIINGMQMDLEQSRYTDFESLKLYCHRVAGVVGRLIARILGFDNPKTLEYADKTGLALQLTNIIRDVGEDARRSRIYLPIDELQRFNVPAHTVMQGKDTPEFKALMAFQVERARRIYREAAAALPPEDRKKQKAGLVMAAIYYALLNEIERDGVQNVLKYKIAIPGPRKKRIALKTWLFGFKP